jgi:hypothetical protein
MAAIAPNTQPSFYYMLIARTCVARSRCAAPARSQALREAANHYLDKAWPNRAAAGRAPETRR